MECFVNRKNNLNKHFYRWCRKTPYWKFVQCPGGLYLFGLDVFLKQALHFYLNHVILKKLSYRKGTVMSQAKISNSVLKRLPSYLAYLKQLPADDAAYISATALASALNMGEVQVRKDLAMVSDGGRPKVGYHRQSLIADIEEFLGYNNTNDAVLVGAGKLGRALLGYVGFAEYGLNIVAAFDNNASICGKPENDKPILLMDQLEAVCRERQILIGIITVPAAQAQAVCDLLIDNGIKAIWNFAPTHLDVPEGILVQYENMATSLAVLSKHLSSQINGF